MFTIDPAHRSHNALAKYPTIYHFVTEMCTRLHISVTKWWIDGYGTGAQCDLWDGSILLSKAENLAAMHKKNYLMTSARHKIQ